MHSNETREWALDSTLRGRKLILDCYEHLQTGMLLLVHENRSGLWSDAPFERRLAMDAVAIPTGPDRREVSHYPDAPFHAVLIDKCMWTATNEMLPYIEIQILSEHGMYWMPLNFSHLEVLQ